jgi:hypothetical protein
MNVFIVTSALLTTSGVFNSMERFEDTIKTLKSIREKDPTADIFLADISMAPLGGIADELQEYCKIVSFNDHRAVKMFSENRYQSQSETVIMMEMMNFLFKNELVFVRDVK